MRTTRLLIPGAMAAAAFALIPAGAPAQGALSGGVEECAAGVGGDFGSCNLVFRNQTSLNTLTLGQLNETVFASCPGFPNGPYQRIDAGNETPIDYVTLEITSTPTAGGSLSAADINDQIGTDVATGVQVTIMGTFGNNNANLTVTQDFPGDRSQIIDLPGFDYILFEKSQGGGQVGTLVCDLNMWFRSGGVGDPQFGLLNFQLDHGVNQITIGWAAGPSGLRSQELAGDACALAGNGAVVDPNLEKKVSYLVGAYKVTAEDSVNPVNVTGCGLDDYDPPAPVIAGYCDPTEVGGTSELPRPNACNPEGQSGGVPSADVSAVNGNASTCFFGGRGTSTSFPC